MTRQVEEQKQELATSVKALGRELERAQRETDQEKREAAGLSKTKEMLMRKVVRGEETYKNAAEDLLLAERHRRGLEDEITQYTNEAVKQRRLIAALEQERELLHADKAELNKQVEILADQLSHAQEDIQLCNREITMVDNKLQDQVRCGPGGVMFPAPSLHAPLPRRCT